MNNDKLYNLLPIETLKRFRAKKYSEKIQILMITVPATWREFPEDIWSSLRTPSDTPVATILDTKNAILFALQILAMRNPQIYAELRSRQEKRFCNIVSFS